MKIWLRCETKKYERRTPIIPQHAALLIKLGFTVNVERSLLRIYSDEEYRVIGCKLVEPGSWKNSASEDYIIGIKELPTSNDVLSEQHIYFAHAYKNQLHAQNLLGIYSNKVLIVDYGWF